MLHWREYKWFDAGDFIKYYIPTIVYLLFKIIDPATSIGVSNLEDKIEKSTLAKFFNNVKYIIDDMSSKYTIIIDKGECHEDYVWHIFRALLSGPNSTFNCFIEIKKDDWDTGLDRLPS